MNNYIKDISLVQDIDNIEKRYQKLDDFNLDDLEKVRYISNSSIIEKVDIEYFRLPKDKKKILGKSDYEKLNNTFLEIVNLNNQNIGKKVYELQLELNYSSESLTIKKNILDIIKRYVKNRISKKNTKDNTAIDKCFRLMSELLPMLIGLSSISSSLNMYFLYDIISYISYSFIHNVINPDYHKETILVKLLKKNGNNILEKDVDEIDEYMKDIVFSILEMKLFLNIETIHIEKLSLEVNFDMLNGNLFRCIYNEDSSKVLYIKFDGRISDGEIFTDYFYEKYEDIAYYQSNLFILETIYDFINEMYSKVDRNKILNDYILSRNKDDEQDKMALAIVSENLAKEETKNSLKGYKIKRNTTWNRFLKILKENFGVVVEQGKGDDIKIYIEGAKDDNSKIYRTSDTRQKKREIRISTQENILKKIGISVNEWVKIHQK